MAMGSGNTKADVLPALAAQEAWLAGNGTWRGMAPRALAVDYSEGRDWFVARTNPRCEDRALATLGAAGFDAFLPKGKREIIHHRTKAKIERTFPLMVGYVFLAMPTLLGARHWGRVRECHGVQAVLGVNGCPMALPGREVEALRLAEAQDRLRFQRAQQVFGKGNQVRITTGPFQSFMGEVVDAEVNGAVVLLINFLNGLVHVSVSVDDLDFA